jgi:hypothetical protein
MIAPCLFKPRFQHAIGYSYILDDNDFGLRNQGSDTWGHAKSCCRFALIVPVLPTAVSAETLRIMSPLRALSAKCGYVDERRTALISDRRAALEGPHD